MELLKCPVAEDNPLLCRVDPNQARVESEEIPSLSVNCFEIRKFHGYHTFQKY